MTAVAAPACAVTDESPWWRRPRILLAAVCVAHALAPLLLVGARFWYEWDETVNISQVSKHAPPGLFTAPRARGMPLLVAPVAELTYSTAALRVYLAIVSSALLYLAFRPWLRVRPGYVVPVAAALFASLWTSIYYGFEAMPNFYVAVGGIAATAYVLLTLRAPPRRRDLALLVAWLVFTGLMRPSDALYLTAPLFLAALVVRAVPMRQRLLVLGCLGAGLALGWAEWVVEAYTSYGGLAARLHAASAENDSGIHMSLGLEARAVAGPTLCRPCTRAVPWPALWWWFLVPPLTALGVWAARRRRDVITTVIPTAAGIALFLQYVVTIDYAAPRFLLPTYALLALPAAEGAALVLGRPQARRRRRALVPVVAVVGAAYLATQLGVLERAIVPNQTRARLQYLSVAANLRRLGVRQPCDVVGYYAAPVAFAAGCTDVPDLFAHAALRRTIATAGIDVAVLTTSSHSAPHAFYRDWPRHRAIGAHLRHAWYVYLHVR